MIGRPRTQGGTRARTTSRQIDQVRCAAGLLEARAEELGEGDGRIVSRGKHEGVQELPHRVYLSCS